GCAQSTIAEFEISGVENNQSTNISISSACKAGIGLFWRWKGGWRVADAGCGKDLKILSEE
ncbi:MAG: hypothetical protein ABFD97_01295, partial [Syntrophobacter sp.]